MTEKQFYDVKIDFLIPTTIVYRISALSEQDALKEAEKPSARAIRQQAAPAKKIKLKATVSKPNSTLIKLTKSYR